MTKKLSKNLTIIFLLIVLVVIISTIVLLLTQRPIINSIPPVSYATYNNELFGFGSNFVGQIGSANSGNSPVLLQSTGIKNIIKYSGGVRHTVVLLGTGEVVQIGTNTLDTNKDLRYVEYKDGADVKKLSNVVDVSAGFDYALALDNTGNVWAWGQNLTGQLGQGDNQPSNYAVKVKNLKDITQISAGVKFALALNKYGDVWGWGGSCTDSQKQKAIDDKNSQNIFNDDDEENDANPQVENDLNVQTENINTYCLDQEEVGISSKLPEQIIGLSNIVKVSAGWGHTLALDNTGNVWAFGSNTYSQVGSTSNNLVPSKIAELKNIVDISAGYRHSLALTKDGKLYGWGYSFEGALTSSAQGKTQRKPIDLNVKNVKTIFAGNDFTVLTNKDGKLLIFGENRSGIITNNLNVLSNSNPKVMYAFQRYASATAGKTFVLALVNY